MADAKHHYIPQFHLREFGAETVRVAGVPGRFGLGRPGHIWQYDKATGTVSKQPIRRAAQRPGYYRLPGEHAAIAELEDHLELLETLTAPLLSALHDEPAGARWLDASERVAIAAYAATLMVRTPARRDPMAAFSNVGGAIFADMELVDAGRFLRRAQQRGDKRADSEIEQDRREMFDALRAGEIAIEAPYENTVENIGIAVNKLMPHLLGMSWLLYRFRGGYRLIIGDQPTVVLPPDGWDDTYGVGVGTEGAVVALPLSPTALLLMAAGDPAGPLVIDDAVDTDPFDLPGAAEINRLSWRWARQFVYGRSRTDVEAAAALFSEDDRNLNPKLVFFGWPPEWERYLSDDIVSAHDPGLPENLIRHSMLPGDVVRRLPRR